MSTFIIITWPSEFERLPELHGPFTDSDQAEAWADALVDKHPMLDEASFTITTPDLS